jgi:hypothetical protein
MSDALTIGTAINVATTARQVIKPVSAGSGELNALRLDSQLRPNLYADVRLVLNARDSKIALSTAILAGNGIVSALTGLKSSAKLAGHESLVSSLTNLSIGGTRISRLNLHVDTNRALSLIDRLVQKSELKNANFISSNSTNIRISTTKFGGGLDVAPQALDTFGLGLRQISLMTTSDANNAAARIESAINIATRRLNGLESIHRLIQSGDFSSRALTGLVTRLSNNALPSGSLVNIIG